MVQVYYRTNESIAKHPVCFAPNEDGLLKEDYELVHEWKTKDAPSLEDIFRQMNCVDGDELCCQLKVRSMMPGDVVVDEDGDVWFCGAAGWEETNWW